MSDDDDVIAGEDPGNNNEDPADFDKTLANLQAFSQPAEIVEPELQDSEDPERDDEFECIVSYYKAAPGYDQMLALDPTSEVIYPGAMLKGESIPTGEYIGINGGRAPITLSISLQNIDGTASVEVENPALDGVRNSVNSLLAQGVNGATPAKLNFTIEEVYSEEHLDIALGANYRSRNKDISASFDFENSEYRYKYIVKYFQEYYTIDMTLPPNTKPGSLFTELPNLNGTSPVIVSSVKYGRMVLYTVESNTEVSDMRTAFSLSFSQGSSEGGGEAEVDYNKIISESKIEALVLGGSAEDAVSVISGPSGVYSYIINGGNYSQDSPGAPLAYTLRYIKEDFPIARVVLASEYPIRNCEEAYYEYRVTIEEIARSGSVQKEIYGDITARIRYQGSFLDNPNDDDDEGVYRASWERGSDSFVDVSPSDPYTVNKSFTITLYKPDLNNDYIKLDAQLYDKNFIGFDDLGDDSDNIYLEEISRAPVNLGLEEPETERSYSHSLESFEDRMKVTFTIKRLN